MCGMVRVTAWSNIVKLDSLVRSENDDKSDFERARTHTGLSKHRTGSTLLAALNNQWARLETLASADIGKSPEEWSCIVYQWRVQM